MTRTEACGLCVHAHVHNWAQSGLIMHKYRQEEEKNKDLSMSEKEKDVILILSSI